MAALSQKVVAACALSLIAVLLSGCQTYPVSMSYTCVNVQTVPAVNTTNVSYTCMEWEQAGGISQPSCFPGHAMVITKAGPKAMSELNLGEEVLGFDHATGVSVFSPVRAWLHRQPGVEVMMTQIEADDATIVASTKHLMAVQGAEEYEFASYLKAGKDVLVTEDGVGATVRKISDVSAQGLYAPLTSTSNFFIANPENRRAVLAHSFAHVRQPRRYEAMFHKFIDIGELLWPSFNKIDAAKDEAYIHPIARLWMWFLRIPTVEEPFIRRRLKMDESNGFDDITAPEEDLQDLAGSNPKGRRLTGGAGNGGGNSEQQRLLVIMIGVVQNLPPFLRHGVSLPGLPFNGTDAVALAAVKPTLDINKYLSDAKTWNTISAVIWSILACCLGGCAIVCQIIGPKDSDSDDSRRLAE